MPVPIAVMSSGRAKHPVPWHWRRDYTPIVVGGLSEELNPNRTPSHNPSRCSFPPLQKSAAELRCEDMIQAHHAELKRHREAEASLREKAEEHQKTCKRIRSEREELKCQNKRLREQLAAAKARPPAKAAPTARPSGDARKRLLALIRQTHPDKESKALDRTKITQGLNDVLELL